MPIARQPADESGKTDDAAERRLSACDDTESDELVWNAPDAELDHVLVSHDGER